MQVPPPRYEICRMFVDYVRRAAWVPSSSLGRAPGRRFVDFSSCMCNAMLGPNRSPLELVAAELALRHMGQRAQQRLVSPLGRALQQYTALHKLT